MEIPTASNENERLPESGYDREQTEIQALENAYELVRERSMEGLTGEPQHEAFLSLMNELAEDNRNRHVVEALARILTVSKAEQKAANLRDTYSVAA